MNRLSILPIILLFSACSVHSNYAPISSDPDDTTSAVAKKTVDTAYLPTGLYFLSETGKGINKRLEQSNEIYTISPLPFASVKNISAAELKKTHLKDGDYTELCLTFDDKGAKDLAAGTGNILHAKFAVVIANRLLYVVENRTSIKAGVINIGLVGYSQQEMEGLRDAVHNKR